MRIKNTIKPVQVNKANERLCDNFNKAKLFCDLYKNPSEWKQQIYARICSGASQRDHSSIHCVGNTFCFSVYYVYKEYDKYYLRCVAPGKITIIEVLVEEV